MNVSPVQQSVIQYANVNTRKPATCPHGSSYGACPICSGAGGGGSSKMTTSEAKSQGLWTWDMCFAYLAMLNAQKARELDNQALDKKIENNALLNNQLAIYNLINAVIITPINNFIAAKITPVVNSINNFIDKSLNKALQNFRKPFKALS
ncbi:MAG: hypothetical protein M0C28_39735 [Candidatus Moduliflexus flocculans]|nr:hypothetical protein [Candidatus Moduliflexus flocculans]